MQRLFSFWKRTLKVVKVKNITTNTNRFKSILPINEGCSSREVCAIVVLLLYFFSMIYYIWSPTLMEGAQSLPGIAICSELRDSCISPQIAERDQKEEVEAIFKSVNLPIVWMLSFRYNLNKSLNSIFHSNISFLIVSRPSMKRSSFKPIYKENRAAIKISKLKTILPRSPQCMYLQLLLLQTIYEFLLVFPESEVISLMIYDPLIIRHAIMAKH